MKIIELSNLQKPCVLVELPEGAKYFEVENPDVENDWNCRVWYKAKKLTRSINVSVVDIHDKIKLLEKFTDLKEEDFGGLVHPEEFVKGHISLGFMNYNGSKYDWFGTAKESFISAIQAEGYYLDIDHTRYVEGDFNEAQQKVIDLNRCYLFVKEV